MLQLLKDIFSDALLSSVLAFKGLCVAIHNPFYVQ